MCLKKQIDLYQSKESMFNNKSIAQIHLPF